MANIFEEYIARRKETKETLDAFYEIVGEIVGGLCKNYPLIDPMNNEPILQMGENSSPDGSRAILLKTSNSRVLIFHFQSNGEVRVVNVLGTETLSEEYVDMALSAEGEASLTTERGESPLAAYIYTWTHGAFEE
jgi:hypothetical protein